LKIFRTFSYSWWFFSYINQFFSFFCIFYIEIFLITFFNCSCLLLVSSCAFVSCFLLSCLPYLYFIVRIISSICIFPIFLVFYLICIQRIFILLKKFYFSSLYIFTLFSTCFFKLHISWNYYYFFSGFHNRYPFGAYPK